MFRNLSIEYQGYTFLENVKCYGCNLGKLHYRFSKGTNPISKSSRKKQENLTRSKEKKNGPNSIIQNSNTTKKTDHLLPRNPDIEVRIVTGGGILVRISAVIQALLQKRRRCTPPPQLPIRLDGPGGGEARGLPTAHQTAEVGEAFGAARVVVVGLVPLP